MTYVKRTKRPVRPTTISEQTRVSLPLEKEIKIILVAAGLIATLYTFKDAALADVRRSITVAIEEERRERQEAQSHLATKEDLQRAVGELRALIIERTKK